MTFSLKKSGKQGYDPLQCPHYEYGYNTFSAHVYIYAKLYNWYLQMDIIITIFRLIGLNMAYILSFLCTHF